MTLISSPLTEINRRAMRVLYRELGVVNAVRFLRQFTPGFGDYTAERQLWLGEPSLDDLIAELRRYPAPEGRAEANSDMQP